MHETLPFCDSISRENQIRHPHFNFIPSPPSLSSLSPLSTPSAEPSSSNPDLGFGSPLFPPPPAQRCEIHRRCRCRCCSRASPFCPCSFLGGNPKHTWVPAEEGVGEEGRSTGAATVAAEQQRQWRWISQLRAGGGGNGGEPKPRSGFDEEGTVEGGEREWNGGRGERGEIGRRGNEIEMGMADLVFPRN
ncbi:hypothetical protein L1049_008577 [Liquidambar formosana]|uniref:Uncharacterized protein n=1 Tax=Liquidambar formosana TaxID=63359 RepID=A0AAP0X8D1_LIQFO